MTKTKKVLSTILVMLLLSVMLIGVTGCEYEAEAKKLTVTGTVISAVKYSVWVKTNPGKSMTEYKDELFRDKFTFKHPDEDKTYSWDQYRSAGGTCVVNLDITGEQVIEFTFRGAVNRENKITITES